jgi:hypothetical protein
MPEYIERKPRYIDIKKFTIPRGFFNQDLNVPKIFDLLYSQPITDVIEVKHGYWKWKELYGEVGYMLVCSECEESEGACERYDYCPNCGAKMDLKEG